MRLLRLLAEVQSQRRRLSETMKRGLDNALMA